MEKKERCKDCGCFMLFVEDCDILDYSGWSCNNSKCPELKKQEEINKMYEY